MRIIRVALPVPLARYFDYLLPKSWKVERGIRVIVPFGNQTKIGIVLDLDVQSELEIEKLKPVNAILDKHSLFNDEIWAMLNWAANYYHAPLGEVLQTALPVKLRQGEASERQAPIRFQLTEQGRKALETGENKRAKKQQEWLASLASLDHFFEKPTACSAAIWQALQDKKYITAVTLPPHSNAWQAQLGEHPICQIANRLSLNKQQSLVVGRISYQQGFATFLLNGVTGSGKTEVYLQAIESCLQRGEQVLVLVPEIGLTPQTIARFQARFNVVVDVLHSHLNDNERLNVWWRAKQGESAIVIGTRSALFTQFQQLGMIILDEEHDSSFKQQEGWRYHARDMAIWRAKHLNIPIVLGSATPSLESLQNVERGKFIELSLHQRAGDAKFASQQLIDLKTQRLHSGLSEKLLAMMQTHLEQGNQVMLFLNRRGFAPVLLCHECGWICQCEQCDKPYTYHQQQRVLRCHHCASQRVLPRQCGYCGSTNLITTGMGTEQLEQVLTTRFPHYKITRIDRDSTSRKGSLASHLNDIQQGKSHILIGTQMLAKGHHFPNVTLVAIVNVDSSLFATDFRAEERLAQLYMQVSGRAGRAEKSGEVVLQTHYPDHPLLQTLLKQGYLAFAKQALAQRQLMQLPPFSAQVLLRATGRDPEKTEQLIKQVADYFQQKIIQASFNPSVQILTFNAPMAKKAGQFRWLLLMQHPSRATLQYLLTQFDLDRPSLNLPNHIRLSIDVDPQEIA